jgi:glycosyltransferase involved in cell wall biosynthesis
VLPKISIVTPSYNQGQFLEDTMLSVLGQNYPNLEYIVMDGGSTDSSAAIIKKHADKLTFWISKKDNGQASAINEGFSRATGDILMWLNSDDLLMPNVLHWIAGHTDTDTAEIQAGNCIHFKAEDNNSLTSWGSDIIRKGNTGELNKIDFIIQPASFWTRKAWEQTGPLNEEMHFTFDWDWFLRATRKNVKLHFVEKGIAMYRFHNTHKSSAGGSVRQQEILKLYQTYNPAWATLYSLLLGEDLGAVKKLQRRLNRLPLRVSVRVSDGYLLKKLKPARYKGFSHNDISLAISML